MANTMTLIASVTVGSGGAATIDFTSIPSTYTDLQLLTSLRQTITGVWENTIVDFNNATTNQRILSLYSGNGVNVTFLDTTRMYNWINASTSTANTFSNSKFYIPNYAGSTYKSMSGDNGSENNAATSFNNISSYLWSSTAAINRITITPNGGSFVQYSTAYLYGINNS
jgi:hypothetical protein